MLMTVSENIDTQWSIPWNVILNERQSLNEIRLYLNTNGELDSKFVLQCGLTIEQFALLYLLKNYRKRMRI
jgi:hypothetical protein